MSVQQQVFPKYTYDIFVLPSDKLLALVPDVR